MELDKQKIRGLLPQSEPILLVDRAVIVEGKHIDAALYIDPKWDVFRGHFKDEPVMPGVYLIEAMAQTADLLLYATKDESGRKPMLASVQRMRFLRPVYPGDEITMTAEVSCDTGEHMYDCSVAVFVEGKKAAGGLITLGMRV